ncbi:MAG: hypothetical protein NXI20_10175 [bacterium]|nr:hypothetical protein [bacterium]
MNSQTKSLIVKLIFLLNGLLFTIGGGYLVISKNITLGTFLHYFVVVGILNLVRVIKFNNKLANKNFDIVILFNNVVITVYHIGYIQLVIIFISVVGLLLRWGTPASGAKS